MRYTVEQWAPEYGSPGDPGLAEPTAQPELGVEVPPGSWAPIAPAAVPVASVLFVDGVRRVDASVWIDQAEGLPVLGLCATYAAGAVACDGRARVVGAEVRRGLFTSAAGAEPITMPMAAYQVRATAGSTPEELWLGIQQRMGELEGAVAAAHQGDHLVIVDGPLSHRRHVAGAVGYVKTQHVQYLPEEVRPILSRLGPGQRTPLFLISTSWSRYSWYLRLPGGGNAPTSGLVRCEVAADLPAKEVALLADRVSATLPPFASAPHKDPRAPHNLYPIGGLERELRRRLGDQHLLYRELRAAAVGWVKGTGSPTEGKVKPPGGRPAPPRR